MNNNMPWVWLQMMQMLHKNISLWTVSYTEDRDSEKIDLKL